MKRIFTLFAVICYSSLSYSQILPNNYFQTWVTETNYEYPENWNTPDPFIAGFPILTTTVSKSTDAYYGDYSVFLETKDILGGTYQVPGLITLADINIDFLNVNFSIAGGMPLQENVSKLTGVYKYDGANGDSATALIYNFKRDTNGDMDTIGYGLKYLHDAPNWTPFAVNMVNLNTNIPDTFNVIILSSALNMSNLQFMTGSRMYVDSLVIETNTGIIPLPFIQETITAYPNPTSAEITFKSENQLTGTNIEIYSLNGKLISSSSFNNSKITMDVSLLITGKYIYVIKEKNTIKARGTFTKI